MADDLEQRVEQLEAALRHVLDAVSAMTGHRARGGQLPVGAEEAREKLGEARRALGD